MVMINLSEEEREVLKQELSGVIESERQQGRTERAEICDDIFAKLVNAK